MSQAVARSRQPLPELEEFVTQRLLAALDRGAVFKDLEPQDRGFYYLAKCPACGRREAYVYKSGAVLKCNLLRSCGQSVSMTAYVNGGTPPKTADEYGQTLAKLSKLADVDLPAALPHDQLERLRRKEVRASILESLLAATQRVLWSPRGEETRKFLHEQGFSDEEIEALGMGLYLSREEMKPALTTLGFQAGDLEDVGVLRAELEGYIIVPWSDDRGRPATIFGRWHQKKSTDSHPLRVSLPGEGAKAFPLCFNLALRANHRDMVLVEAVFDAFYLQAKHETRVVTCSSLQLSQAQAETFAKHRVRSVTIAAADHGEQNLRRIYATIEKLNGVGVAVYVAPVTPHGLEIGDFVRKDGLPAFKELIARAISGPVFRTKHMLHGVSPHGGDLERQEAVEKALEYYSTVAEQRVGVDREDVLKATAEATGYGLESLRKLAESFTERRRLESLLREAQHACSDLGRDVGDLSRRLIAELSMFETGRRETLAFSFDRLEKKSRETPLGKPSGWAALDAAGVQFHPGELTVLSARSGHGKTSALVGLMLNWLATADDDGRIVYYSAEEPDVRIYHRMLSAVSADGGVGWTTSDVRDYLRDPGSRGRDHRWPDAKLLEKAKAKLRDWEKRLQIVYCAGWNTAQLQAHAESLARQQPLSAVIVDFLQILRPAAGDTGNAVSETSAVARRLKAIAVDLNSPVVAGANLDVDYSSLDLRSKIARIERYRDSLNIIRSARPTPHHLVGAGYEQEADLVLGMLNYAADYRSESDKPREIPEVTLLEIGALKSRFGSTGAWAELSFVGRYGIIESPVEEEVQPEMV
ncbi:MAG: DnaB-like helicase C-terminal domain-containing protein [Planctomycetia bacterium]